MTNLLRGSASINGGFPRNSQRDHSRNEIEWRQASGSLFDGSECKGRVRVTARRVPLYGCTLLYVYPEVSVKALIR